MVISTEGLETAAKETLRSCLGTDLRGLRTVRVSANVVMADPDAGIVARIPIPGICGRMPTARALQAIWDLSSAGAPLIRPLETEIFRIPPDEAGRTSGLVTVWPFIEPAVGIHGNDVAAAMGALHDPGWSAHPAAAMLPVFNYKRYWPDREAALAAAADFGADEIDVLRGLVRAEAGWEGLCGKPEWPSDRGVGRGLVHLDSYPDNLGRDPDGRLIWLDLDNLSRGPREADLIHLLKTARRFSEAFPDFGDEDSVLGAYPLWFDREAVSDLWSVIELAGVLETAEIARKNPTEANVSRAIQRVGTLGDPFAAWDIA